MATSLYADGLGGTVDMIALNEPFYGLDSVAWYVHSSGPLPSGASGRDKQRPFPRIRDAVAVASANDIIVVLEGHKDIISTPTIAITQRGLVIVGCGETAGVPSVSIENQDATSVSFTVSAPNVQFRNIRFLDHTQDSSAASISVSSSGFVLDGCRFECGVFSNGTAVVLGAGADGARIRDTTFISTAISPTLNRPTAGLRTTAAIAGLHMIGAEFSDGTVGFSSGYAADFSAGAVTDLMADSVSLLLGASMRLGAATTGYVIPVVTGGGVIDI